MLFFVVKVPAFYDTLLVLHDSCSGRCGHRPLQFAACPTFALYVQISLDGLERIQNAVHVAALIAMAGIDAGADEAVADVIARAERRFDVGAVVRIDVNGIVCTLALCRVDKLADDGVAVRAAGILGADGYLPLCAGKTVT